MWRELSGILYTEYRKKFPWENQIYQLSVGTVNKRDIVYFGVISPTKDLNNLNADGFRVAFNPGDVLEMCALKEGKISSLTPKEYVSEREAFRFAMQHHRELYIELGNQIPSLQQSLESRFRMLLSPTQT